MAGVKQNREPLVSVVLPVYNGERYLAPAIDSILGQSYRNFELLLIDDGSTDRSAEIIGRYVDPRIVFIRNEKNLKLIATLNKGFALAKGELIARMDADDIAAQRRLERQVARFLEDPELVALGTDMTYIDAEGRPAGRPRRLAAGPAIVRWRLLRGSCLYHPTVMVNRKMAGNEARYRPEFIHAEDFELWLRLSREHRLDNLPESLLSYRVHEGSVSHRYRKSQLESAARALVEHVVAVYGFQLTVEQAKGLLDPRYYVRRGSDTGASPFGLLLELERRFCATESQASRQELREVASDVAFFGLKLAVVTLLEWKAGLLLRHRLTTLVACAYGLVSRPRAVSSAVMRWFREK